MRVSFLSFLLVAALSAQARGAAPERIFLIGLDGATWTILDTLFKEGRTPNLQACAERGVRAPLETLTDYPSPALWTTIATGRKPKDHGILDFMKDAKRNLPYIPSDRKAAALWDILGAAGKSVLVVGYFATHPAEPVNGVMVSNQLVTVKEGWIQPESARGAVDRAVSEKSFTREDLRRFTPYPDGAPGNALYAPLLTLLYNFYTGDWFKLRAAEALLSGRRYDFFTIHIWGTDNAAHIFGRFSRFDPRDTPSEERKVLGPVLERYYAFADEAVGRLAKHADARTALLIVSDHGMSPRRVWWRRDILAAAAAGTQFWSHEDGEKGILIACGPGILPGAQARKASILDLAPTLLRLAGLPRASDMPGRVLTELLEPALASHPPGPSVASYPRPRPARGGRDALSPEEINSLRVLGYVR